MISFVIISKGSSPFLDMQILSIIQNCDFQVEIIQVGGKQSQYCDVYLPFRERRYRSSLKRNFQLFRRKKNLLDLIMPDGFISEKKNIGVLNAQFENVFVLHDYLALASKIDHLILDAVKSVTVGVPKITNLDGRRYRDWISYDDPSIGGPFLLPYEEVHNPHGYISGSLFFTNRSFFKSNKLDETILWGEHGEDVEWSKRVREKTSLTLMNDIKFQSLKQISSTNAPYTEHWRDNLDKYLRNKK